MAPACTLNSSVASSAHFNKAPIHALHLSHPYMILRETPPCKIISSFDILSYSFTRRTKTQYRSFWRSLYFPINIIKAGHSHSCMAHQFYSSAAVTPLHISLKMLFMTSDEKCDLCTDLLVMQTGCVKIDPTLPDTCRFWGASEASLFSRLAVKFDRWTRMESIC